MSGPRGCRRPSFDGWPSKLIKLVSFRRGKPFGLSGPQATERLIDVISADRVNEIRERKKRDENDNG